MQPVTPKLGSVLLCALAASFALAEDVLVNVDPTYPSGGSGAPRVFSGGGTAVVDLDLSILPAVPTNSLPETPGGPKTPAASLTFTGVIQSSVPSEGLNYKPPDTHAAVGTGAGAAGRVVEITNTGVQIYDKTGSTVAGPTDLDLFLTALGASGLTGTFSTNLAFDPKVIFDQHSSRFFIVILDGRTAGVRSNVHICTSKSATPGTLTSTDWTVETASALTTFGLNDTWFDYPGIGADSTRLIITGNMFDSGSTFRGTKIRVFLKSSLTDNGTPSGSTFNDLDIDRAVTMGISTVQPAHVFGSTLNGDFYLINRLAQSVYRMWQITGAGGSASLAAGSPTTHTWSAGNLVAAGAPQTTDGMNADPTIDTLSDRIMSAVYRNDGGNTDSIWCCLTADIILGDSGASEVVWFEIDPNSANSAVAGTLTTPTINDSGSIDGTTAGDWTFMPSISVNSSGDIAICFNESDSSSAVEMRVTTRHVSDPSGTFQTPVTIATGAGEYDDFSTQDPERWGDYSACVVDPDDDETFWVAHEVCQTAVTSGGNDADWGTRIAKMGSVVAVPVELSTFRVE